MGLLVDSILERNREFVRGREARELPPVEVKHLVVVACYDPRLDALLFPALGIPHGEAFLLRTAGALVLPGGGVMRSLGLAVFMFGATEILVLGHTSCRMANFRATEFIEVFRARGVGREAFGAEDLREWAGAIPSPQAGVRRSVDHIASAPFLPRDVSVSGAVLDDTTGALELLVRGGRSVAAPEAQPAATAEAAPPEPSVEVEPPVDAAAPGEGLTPLVASIADVVTQVERQKRWRAETKLLRENLGRVSSPMARFRLLEAYLRKVAGNSKEVVQALERLRKEIGASDRGVPDALSKMLQRLSGGRG
jgi:carbonic anhydrase